MGIKLTMSHLSYPAPDYVWAKTDNTETRITGCGEKMCVQDFGRELLIFKVSEEDYGGYFCQATISNTYTSQVLELQRKPSSYQIRFEGITPPQTIIPNRYYTFNLTCSVNIAFSDKVCVTRSVTGSYTL